MLTACVVDDRRLGKKVIGNRLEVAVAEVFETIIDGLPHRAFDPALLGRHAGFQERDDVFRFPLADPGIRIRRYVRDKLTVWPVWPVRRPSQPLTGSRSAAKMARRVAFAAMRGGGGEIS